MLPQVDTFYEFWFEFKSWRDFSADDEYDLEDAGDRYERRHQHSAPSTTLLLRACRPMPAGLSYLVSARRWMEQQNARERKKLMKEVQTHRTTTLGCRLWCG